MCFPSGPKVRAAEPPPTPAAAPTAPVIAGANNKAAAGKQKGTSVLQIDLAAGNALTPGKTGINLPGAALPPL